MNYKHPSLFERYQIYALMKAGHDQTQIAKLLDRNKSTICRELSRNCWHKDYRPKQSCELTTKKSKQSRNAETVPAWVCEQTAQLLCLQWSPGQIAGKVPVSHETLYQHVYADKAKAVNLWKSLRCQKQKRKRYASGRGRQGQIPHRRPLRDGPFHIEARKQVGHWVCNTVIGSNHNGALVTMVERKSGFGVIVKVAHKTSEVVINAIVKGLQPFAGRVKTLTYDNCKEFASYIQIDQTLKSTGYFARPFASWDRSSNENLNGLLRQYAPKKRLMNAVDEEELTMIQNRLNYRTRKRIRSKTTSEVFHKFLKRVALRT